MMIRLPDALFRPLERLVDAQRRVRRAEAARRAAEYDAELRASARRLEALHVAGECRDRCPFWHGDPDDTTRWGAA